MIALGILAFLVLQKHLMRPMETQMIVYPLVAVLLFALMAPGTTRVVGLMTLGVAAGVFAALVVVGGSSAVLWSTVCQAPTRLAETLRVMSNPALVALANGERFAPARFQNFFAERQVLAELSARVPEGRLSIFTLTDAPILYVLTAQPAVWMSNMYNASPVYEQRRVVDWLEEDRPDFVVFEADQLQFDGVPTAVRVPLIVGAVVAHYVPDRQIARFEVLRRRTPSEPMAIDYWREKLGATLNLGRVPAEIDVAGRVACGGSRNCDEYVTVDLPPPADAGQAGMLQFNVGRPFEVRFDLEPGRGHYVIPVGRLWFWRGGVSAGLQPIVERPPNAASQLTPIRLLASDRLY